MPKFSLIVTLLPDLKVRIEHFKEQTDMFCQGD